VPSGRERHDSDVGLQSAAAINFCVRVAYFDGHKFAINRDRGAASSTGLPTARDRQYFAAGGPQASSVFLQASQNREVALVHQLATKARHISDASFFVFVSSAVLLRESDLEAGT
jgi:hypothetical protein